MRARRIAIGLGLLVVVGLWAAFRPELLFVDKTVNETFEQAMTGADSRSSRAPSSDSDGLPSDATSAVDANTSEANAGEASPPTTAPVLLVAGQFQSVAHESEGRASVYRLADATRILRLTEFDTSNGPDLRLYLVAADDATDNDTVKNSEFVDLGTLKGNRGNQNYVIPDDVDLGQFRAVTIWCRRFSVNFGTAALRPQS